MPRIDDAVRRTTQVSIRLHPRERERIERAAEAAAMTLTEWARGVLLAHAAREAPDPDAIGAGPRPDRPHVTP